MELTEDLIYYWLSVSGLSPRKANALLSEYTPLELWEGIGKTLTSVSFFGERAYEALIRYRNFDYLQRSVDALDNDGISFLPQNRFPECLIQSEVDPPIILYYRGDISLVHTNCVAVVGTRACSPYGKEAATRLVTDLCNYNVTIVSGLATGIDMYAHRAAVQANGKTIAVLGSGLNDVQPVSNIPLYRDILASGGLVLSEYAPSRPASKYTFPERNRIVSGLSQGVIVVEAGLKSGALITADCALDQNRTLFAVPSNITNVKALGSNRLLFDGAIAALTAEDICKTLNFSFGKIERKERAVQLDIFEQKIYNILSGGDENFDSLVIKAEIAPPKLSAVLSALEIKGIVQRKPSNVYGLTH
ncbi:MAG: DNA-processing protein DprA [Clostridiales bacterium]|nr:DNA-processing protein DprA [Clostridiales bacterium]